MKFYRNLSFNYYNLNWRLYIYIKKNFYFNLQTSDFMTNPDDLEKNEAEMFAMFEKMQEEEDKKINEEGRSIR